MTYTWFAEKPFIPLYTGTQVAVGTNLNLIHLKTTKIGVISTHGKYQRSMKKLGHQVRDSISIVDLLPWVKFPPKSCAVRYYLAGTSNFPSSCPSLVYITDVHCIYKSNVPFIDQENFI